MKKNLFFGLMALAGLFTSCSQDDAYAPPTADSNQVSMSIGMPADFVKTRATAPALANHKLRCILEVWTQDGATLKVRKEQPVTEGAANITFTFELADQGEYKAVLWADYIAENATETSGHYADKYYKTDDADGLKKVSIITNSYPYTDQVREAFTAVVPFTKDATAKNDLTATLVRPLTKVTIAEKNAEMFAKCNSMTAAYTVPSEFNAFSEEVSATATYAATYNAAPVGGADITINGKACKILFSDYVFTATDGTMGGIELTFTGSATLNNRSIPANIPLKRNNWVRAAGNLITADASGYDPAVSMTVDMTTDWVEHDATDIPDIVKPKVGDYYYKDGTWSTENEATDNNPILGVVYKVNADGTGKVVSHIEKTGAWTRLGSEAVTGATSATNGKENTNKVLEFITKNSTLNDYPIFKSCQELRTSTGEERWYIPVVNDYIDDLFKVVSTINNKISAISGTEVVVASQLESNTAYWSSQEHGKSYAYLIIDDDRSSQSYKKVQAKVRFVLDF